MPRRVPRSSPHRGRALRSRLRLTTGRPRFLAAPYDLGLVIRVEPQGPVDGLLAGQRVGISSGLVEGLAVYLTSEVPDELPLHDGAPHGTYLVLGVGVEVEAHYLAVLAVAYVLQRLRELEGLHEEV